MAKDYYQLNNGGFRLDPSTYRCIVWKARRYPILKYFLSEIEDMNPLRLKPQDIVNKAELEWQINVLESSIDKYVEEPYKEAVKEHSWYAVEYLDLEEKYYLTTSMMKRAVQKYIWGLAQEFGEDFTR